MGLAYNINKESKDAIVLSESTAMSGCFFASVLIIALIVIGLAGKYYYDYSILGLPLNTNLYIYLGLGILFGSGAILIKMTSEDNPHEIVFDNKNASVIVTQEQKGSVKKAEIPYQDILGFDYRAESTSDSSSSSTSGSYNNYVVFWRKKDGGIWDITSFNKADKAVNLINELQELIDLSLKGDTSFTPKMPDGVILQSADGRVSIQWKNEFSYKSFLFLVIVGAFATIIHGAMGDEATYTSFHFMHIFLGVMLIITSIGLSNIIKNAMYSYYLEISSETLTFSHISRNKKKVVKEIPLSEIRAVGFDFKDQIGGSSITIMDQAQYEMTQKTISGDIKLSDLGAMVKTTFGTLQLNIDHLDIVDKINLEAALQIIINEKGGNVVV